MRDISFHIQRLLFLLGGIFTLFALRIYYLSIIQRDFHQQEAKRPALKTVIKRPSRGTIRDRFNKPLAINTISYSLSVMYEPIKALPRRQFIVKNGKKTCIYPRKRAITALSKYLTNFCDHNEQYIEDLIYSKASLFPNTPFSLKDEVEEDVYFKLKMKESHYPGLYMQIQQKRTYPLGKIGSHILGYMGAIGEKEHLAIKSSIQQLQEYLDNQKADGLLPLPKGYSSINEVKKTLTSLLNKSYTIHSKVGKSGIEKQFDAELKGSIGKDYYLVNHKGSRRQKLPESFEAVPGRRVLLSISSELQEHCEKLLADSEKIRSDGFSRAGKNHHKIPTPWIAGGAIIAMIPSTGEIVAMASYPTFDPNDFTSTSKEKALKWLETPSQIGKVFDGIYPLEKDLYNITTKEESTCKQELSYDFYLETILSKNSSVKKALKKVRNIHQANFLLNSMEMLLSLSGEKEMQPLIDALFQQSEDIPTFFATTKEKKEAILTSIRSKTSLLGEIKKEISHYLTIIPKNDDKILLLDLLRLFCPNHLFDDSLLAETGKESLATYKEFTNAKVQVEKEVHKIAKKVFHEQEFAEWRAAYFKEYLKGKREEERAKKRYAKPYLSYLEQMEKKLFHQFFEINKWEFLQAYLTVGAPVKEGDIRLPYFQALIAKSLEGDTPSYAKLKKHLEQLSSEQIIPYLKTMRSYKELGRNLFGKYYFPFKSGKKATEQDLARAFYPGSGFGFCKSAAFADLLPLGSSFKIFVGYEALNDYFADHPKEPFPINPMTIIDRSPPYSAKIQKDTILGYHLNYSPIRRIYKGGRLPRGHQNIGKIDFLSAMEKSSNLYYSLLTSDVIKDPMSLINTAKTLGFGKYTGIDLPFECKGAVPEDILLNKTSLFSFAIGQHSLIVTPLQTAVALSAFANNGSVLKPQIVKAIANIEPTKDAPSLLFKNSSTYEGAYKNVGIFFPLFPEGEESDPSLYLKKMKKERVTSIDIPTPVHQTLMQSLYNVVNNSKGTARISAIGSLIDSPYKRSIYKKVMKSMAGKTSTAEIAYNPTLDREQPPIITKNIWFTAISYPEERVDTPPDLVVIVGLRFGPHGKEAAPLAASVIDKWRQITKEQEQLEALQ